MKSQQRRGPDGDRDFQYALRRHERRAQAQQETVQGAQLRCLLSRSIQDQQLMLHKKRFGDDCTGTARSHGPDRRDDQMSDQDEPIPHTANADRPWPELQGYETSRQLRQTFNSPWSRSRAPRSRTPRVIPPMRSWLSSQSPPSARCHAPLPGCLLAYIGEYRHFASGAGSRGGNYLIPCFGTTRNHGVTADLDSVTPHLRPWCGAPRDVNPEHSDANPRKWWRRVASSYR